MFNKILNPIKRLFKKKEVDLVVFVGDEEDLIAVEAMYAELFKMRKQGVRTHKPAISVRIDGTKGN